jgi:hypothetical protein
MKKIYSIFSLFLMILGINTAYAGVSLGNSVTDPSTLTNGSKIIIRSNGFVNEANATYKFFSALADSIVYSVTTIDPVDPYVTYSLETAEGKTVSNEQAYYLKNEYNGKYVTYRYEAGEDGSVTDDGSGSWVAEMYLTFTADKAKATPVIIKTQAEGGKLMGYTGDAPTAEGCMMIIAEFPEHNNDLIAFNYVYDRPLIASYNDYATWWQIYEANIVEDYIADLSSLFTKVEQLKFIGGTDPGCYDQAMVDAFEKARTNAQDLLNSTDGSLTPENAKTAYKTLEDAYLALVVGTAVPVTEGYYRIKSAYSAFTAQQGAEAIKTIYTDNTDIMKWKNLDNEDATMVWQFIDRHDGTWLLYNVGTGTYVNAAKSTGQSSNYTMTSDSTGCAVKITGLGQSAFNLISNLSGQYAFHTGGHSSGAGVSGNIVAWNGGLETGSAWYINKVDDEQIPGFEAIGEQNKLNRSLESLYNTAKAKYDIGSSFTITTEPEKWLVTSADYEADKKVAMSNADHNEWHPSAPDGGGIPALLDNDEATFWGSCWSDPQPDTTQYLQFKLNKKVNAFAVYFTKRKNQPNQATQLTFYVSNDTTKADGWVKAGTITGLPGSTDNSGNGLTYQSNGIELDAAYQYVRMTWKSANGFTHFTGFHFQEAVLSQDCQNVTMGEVAQNLKAELKNAETLLAAGKATQEAIDALQAAYDAYVAELADPTALKAKLDSISNVCKLAATIEGVDGTGANGEFKEGNPGVYPVAAKAALQATIDEVQSYIDANDAAGTYTKKDITANLDKLVKALDTFKATAPKFTLADASNEGIWYYISYSQHYFNCTGKTPDTSGEGDAQQIRKGKLYVNADVTSDLLNNAKVNVTGNKTLEELGVNDDMAKWRFVNLGDTAYAIQNKATGLYLGEKTGGNAGLSMTPAAYRLSDIGYATFLIEGYRLNGAAINPLHIQTSGQLLVYWDNRDLGGGSCFDIEPTTDNTAAAILNFRAEEMIKGRLYTKCYPLPIELVADNIDPAAYPYQIATIDVAKKEMTLAVYEDVIEAGQPFFYIGGGATLGVSQEPTAADTTQMLIQFPKNETKTIAQTPSSYNGLIGNYYSGTKVAKGFGVVKDTKGVQSIDATTEDQQIGWNSAYIDASKIENAETPGTIVVPLTGNLETAIKDAIIDAQTGNVNVYSVDGILIKKNVKVSEATEGLAKGIYIVGNKKVAVK